MLAEGQNPRGIESAGLQAGMPMGPLEVADMVGLNLAVHIREQEEQDLAAVGKKLPPEPTFDVLTMMVREKKRVGKGQGAGFYNYGQDGSKSLWPDLYGIFPRAVDKLSQAEMIERLMFVQVLETVRVFEEGVVTSVADANLGSILGWGFAPFKGGTLQYIDDYGVAGFVARCRQLEAVYGERFAPPKTLVEMAASGKSF
jgi:3-hydroxyacyl-CoA dehydrogenase/enoyl-CoA hydratase/3-hydroxybutyryl-CoA epimerase